MKLLLKFLVLISFGLVFGYEKCVQDRVRTNQKGIPGGTLSVPIDDEIEAIALNASILWNYDYSNERNFYKVVCIHSAKTQVVAGSLYTIKVTIAETRCSLSDMLASEEHLTQEEVDECPLKRQADYLTCEFKYWSRPWLQSYQLTGVQSSKNQAHKKPSKKTGNGSNI